MWEGDCPSVMPRQVVLRDEVVVGGCRGCYLVLVLLLLLSELVADKEKAVCGSD